MVAELGVRVDAVVPARVHVDHGSVELHDVVEEPVADLLGDVVDMSQSTVIAKDASSACPTQRTRTCEMSRQHELVVSDVGTRAE